MEYEVVIFFLILRSDSDFFSNSLCFFRKKKEEKQKDYVQSESPVEKPGGMMEDVSLQILIKIAKEYIFPLDDEKEQCEALAR